ncbi:hypothetical protein MHD_08245 [Mannheimia granulomatis]|uniref:Autotransporter adhesin n=1 Tax=Mannheimia granulomatis TaxID=85402 RepID=A0A011LYS5_9PAST|nr:YadA-like family protein [Mannheimia granulomatis]EXI62393.1 hypothetical protein AK33_06245 [Mannheimia granulomatis]RGE47794.1 hypothetical protein MHD_08245 [Mannheimia granulomatis]
MNKIFKVIFNRTTQKMEVVSELARSQGKASASTDERGGINLVVTAIKGATALGSAVLMLSSAPTEAAISIESTDSNGGRVTVNTTTMTAANGQPNGTTNPYNYYNPGSISYEDAQNLTDAYKNYYNNKTSTGIAIGAYTNALQKHNNFSNGIAIGDYAQATGGLSIAIGAHSKSTDVGSVALGTSARADGFNSFAAMRQSAATADYAAAVGSSAWANGTASFAMGASATALGNRSFAIGAGVPQTIDANTNGEVRRSIYDGANNTLASGADAFSIGTKAKTNGNSSFAIGTNAQAGGFITEKHKTFSEKLGNVTNADSTKIANNAFALGTNTRANSNDSVAFSTNATATGEGAIAFGVKSVANGTGAIAFGNVSNTTGANAISIGWNSTSTAEKVIAIGANAATTKSGGTAIGESAKSDGENASTIGFNSSVNSANATAIGANSIVTDSGTAGTAIGFNTNVSGQYGTAIAYDAKASGLNALAIGTKTTVTGDNSAAVGTSNIVNTNKTFAVGNNITTTVENSVFLGDQSAYVAKSNSTDGVGSVTEPVTVNGVQYGSFAGKTSVGVVSVGSNGAERRIQNVAAGLIAAGSTDAINGSQLYQTQQVLGNVAKTTVTHLGGGSAVGTDGSLTAPTYNVVKGNASPAQAGNSDQNFTTNPAKNVGDALTNLNTYINQGFNVQDNVGTVKGVVTPGESVKFANGIATTAIVDQEANSVTTVKYDVAVDGTSIKVENGKLTATVKAPETTTLTVNNNGTVKPTDEAKKGNLVTAETVSNAINNAGFYTIATAAGGGELKTTPNQKAFIKAGDTLTLDAGKNIQLAQGESGIFTIATKDNVTFNSVNSSTITVPGVTSGTGGGNSVIIDSNGINAGNKPITYVADGTNNTDAVNVGQLKAAKTEVKQGSNTSVKETKGNDKQAIYTVHADKAVTKAEENGMVSVTPNEAVDQETGAKTTTYTVDLTAEAKKDIVDGKKHSSVVGDSNVVVTPNQTPNANGGTQYDVKLANKVVVGTPNIDLSVKTSPVTIDGMNGTVSGLTNTTWDPNTTYTGGQAATQEQLKAVSDAAQKGWNLKVNSGGETKVAPGETVTFKEGKNIKVTQNGKDVTIATTDNVVTTETDKYVTGGTTEYNDKGEATTTLTGVNGAGGTVTGIKNYYVAKADTQADGKKATLTRNDGDTVDIDLTKTVEAAVEEATKKGTKYAGDKAETAGSQNEFSRKLGETTKVLGGADGALSNKNIGVLSNGTDTLTVKLAKELKDLTSAEFKDTDGNTTTIGSKGITINPQADGKSNVTLTANGLDNGNNQIKNVAEGTDGNDAVNVNQLRTEVAASKENVVSSDGSIKVDRKVNPDYSTEFDVTVNVDGTTITKGENGGLKANTTNLTIEGATDEKPEGIGKVATPTNGTSLVTASTVADVINKSGFTLTTSVNGGTKDPASTSDEVINPGDKIDMAAGKNLVVKQDANGKITYSTTDDIQLGTKGEPGVPGKEGVDGKLGVNGKDGAIITLDGAAGTIGASGPKGEDGKPGASVVLNGKDGSIGLTGPKGQDGKDGASTNLSVKDGAEGVDGKAKDGLPGKDGETRLVYTNKLGQPEQIANLNDGLIFTGNNEELNRHKLNTVVKIVGEGVNKEASTSFKSAVGNINVVADKNDKLEIQLNRELRDLGKATFVEYKAENGKDVVNQDAPKSEVTNKGITITSKDGKPGESGNVVSLTDTGLNNGGNTIVNVKSNLVDNGIATEVPVQNSKHNLADKVNNAATVGDVLNAGWNLQGNGQPVDVVSHADTVNFINGRGTIITVENNAATGVNTIKVDSPLAYVGGNPNDVTDTSTPSNTVTLYGGNGKSVQVTNVASGVRDTVIPTGEGDKSTAADVSKAIKEAKGDTLTNAVNVGDLKDTINDTITTVSTDAYGLKDKAGNYFTQNLGTTAQITGDDNINTKVVEVKGETGKVTGKALEVSLNPTVELGKAGKDGVDGKLGVNGKDGAVITLDGAAGTIGASGPKGEDGKPGASVVLNGKDGSIGINGKDGTNGTMTFAQGKPGVDGKDGKTRLVYQPTDKDGNPIKDDKGNPITEEVATLNDGLIFAGNNDKLNRHKLNSIVNIVGEVAQGINDKVSSENFKSAAGNINVVANEKDQLEIQLNRELKDLTSAKFVEYKQGDGDKEVVDNTKPSTEITNKGITITPANGENGTDAKPVSLTDKGLDNGNNQIVNVKSGIDGVDGIGKDGQPVKSVNDLTKEQLDRVGTNAANINDVRNATDGLINKGFNITADNKDLADGADKDNVKLGETVNYTSTDKNIVTTVRDNAIDFGLSSKLSVGKDGKGGLPGEAGTIGVKGQDGKDGVSITGDNGKDGQPGEATITVGRDGKDGADGDNGIDGKVGVNGKDGSAVVLNGKDGSIGLNGKDGKDGLTFKSADGAQGVDGTNGADGLPGKDGKTRLIYQPTDKDGNPINDKDGNPVKEEVATLNDGLIFTGNNEDTKNRHKLNTLVKVQGEGVSKEQSASFKSASGNINVKANGTDVLEIQLNRDLKDLGNATFVEYKKDENGKDVINQDAPKTVVNNNGVTITPKDGKDGKDGNVVSLTKDGLNNGGNQIVNVKSGIDGLNGQNGKDGQPITSVNDLTPDQLKDVGTNAANINDVVNASNDIIEKGFSIAADNGEADHVKLGETVKYTSKDKNIITTVSDNVIDFALNNDLTVGGPGKDGQPGKDGSIGVKGADGTAGVTLNGKDGSIGLTGPRGADGKDGASATISVKDGAKGLDGNDGKNGESKTRIVYEKPNGEKEEVATLNDGLRFVGDDGKVIDKKLNETLQISGGDTDLEDLSDDNIGVVSKDGKLMVKLAKNIDLTDEGSITIGDTYLDKNVIGVGDSALTGDSLTVGGDNSITVDGNKGTIGGLTNKTFDPNNFTSGQAATEDQLKQVYDVANSGWDIAANGQNTTNVGPKGKVSFNNEDGNIIITKETTDNNVTFALNNNLTIGGPGKDGAIGVKGADGTTGVTLNGKDGSIGINGKDGTNGTMTFAQGKPGVDGKDGETKSRIVYETKDKDGNPVKEEVATLNDGLKFVGDDGEVITKKLNETLSITGGEKDATKLSDANNIGVVNNNGTLTVKLAKDIDLTKDGSVTIGDTTVNNDGLTIKGGPSVTKAGINAGDKKITNVQDGEISETSKDAVNGSQLYQVQQVANAGWNLSANGKDLGNVKPGATVDLNNKDGNIVITKEGNNVTFGLNNDLTIGGKDGKDGQIGVAGKDGKDGVTIKGDGTITAGRDGKDGVDGQIGATGKDGASVVLNGKDGSIGLTGPKGADGKPGATANIAVKDGAEGVDGTNGKDGLPGENGKTRIVYETKDKDGKPVTEQVATLNDGLIFSGNNEDTKNRQKLNTEVKVKGEGVDKAASENFKSATGNINVKANGSDTLEIQLAKNVDLTQDGSVTVGDTKVDNKGLTIKNGPSVTKDGIDAKGTKITNVKDGDVTATSKDAVNGSQLYNAVQNSGWELTVNGEAESQRINNNSKVNIKSGRNIEVSRKGSTVEIATSSNPEFDTVKVGGTTLSSTVAKDGVNELNVAGKDGSATRITNVAPGVKGTDAVNVNQLRSVANHVNNVDKDLRAGVAGALAAGNLYHVTQPGKSMVSAGVGTYRGQGALAVGYSRLSDNGKVGIKFSVNSNSRGHAGAAASVGYQW